MTDPTRIRLLTAVLTALPLAAQMELRRQGLYDDSEFAREAPALGEAVPDLRLFDLEGRPRSLALERGRTVVLIAASFT